MATVVDINLISHLYDVAVGGRSKGARTRARNQLGEILGKEVNRANQRMRELEKQGLDYGLAYDTAAEYLEGRGRKRFRRPGKNLAAASEDQIRELYEETLRARQFLASKASTVSGQKRINKERNETFREKWPELTEGKSDEWLTDFQRFLGGTGVQDFLKFFRDSGEEVEVLGELFDDSQEAETMRPALQELFSEYEKFNEWRDKNPDADIRDRVGLTFTELKMELDKLYESASKRGR